MNHDHSIIIIGGGIAGLSAANHLIDSGITPLVIEKGVYSEQNVCGKFISFECLTRLEKWDIPISNYIDRCCFYKNHSSFSFPLPQMCGAISRGELEEQLYKRATQKGVNFLLRTAIERWENDKVFLKSGDILQSKKIIIGASNLSGNIPPFSYWGYKTHLTGSDLGHVLQVHLLPKGYYGLKSLGKGITNMALLSSTPVNPHAFLPEGTSPLFEFIETKVPEFGIKNTPPSANVFWIGDARGRIPPVSGDGVALAVESGIMAAEYAIKGEAEAFHRDWKKRFQKRFTWAMRIHRSMMIRSVSQAMMLFCQQFPSIPQTLFNYTHS